MRPILKRSEGWGTKLRKNISNSLSLKVFLWVFAALTVCSTILYGIVLTVLPKQYQIASDKQMERNVDALVSKLQQAPYEEGIQNIYNFCIRNNASAMLIGEENTLNFGEIQSDEPTVATLTIGTDVTFLDSETAYMLVLSSLTRTAERISGLMLRFLPVIFLIIALLSVSSALICSKVIVAPMVKISHISKRMTELDMTWRCDIQSDDEIGVLASSLNTMAARLQSAMEELETANQQLTKDVKRFQRLEEQHRNFFAAVSHELKTPLTILKGQLENMMLGFGDYQNHEKYLPQALKSAEDIETLVKEILSITKMETMDIGRSLETLPLSDMVSKLIADRKPLADEKGISIDQNIPDDVCVSVHPDLFHKALSNIIGNAIRHSRAGAKVTVNFDRDSHALAVENTGVFLSEDALENLFTPFYRADQSRSKATGGSGLGLYIVKTILDLHGMGYRIVNTENGVAFYLKLN